LLPPRDWIREKGIGSHELLLVSRERNLRGSSDDLGRSSSLLLDGRKASSEDGLSDEGHGHSEVESIDSSPLSGSLLSGLAVSGEGDEEGEDVSSSERGRRGKAMTREKEEETNSRILLTMGSPSSSLYLRISQVTGKKEGRRTLATKRRIDELVRNEAD